MHQEHSAKPACTDQHATKLRQNIKVGYLREGAQTQCPVREVLQQLHVGGDGEDVQEMEEDVHHDDDSQVHEALQIDVPHLPLFPGQV